VEPGVPTSGDGGVDGAWVVGPGVLAVDDDDLDNAGQTTRIVEPGVPASDDSNVNGAGQPTRIVEPGVSASDDGG
jgi:hypothetical protein